MGTPKIEAEIAENGELTIRVVPDRNPPRSRSGKTLIRASTRGALTLQDGSKLNLNWYAYP